MNPDNSKKLRIALIVITLIIAVPFFLAYSFIFHLPGIITQEPLLILFLPAYFFQALSLAIYALPAFLLAVMLHVYAKNKIVRVTSLVMMASSIFFVIFSPIFLLTQSNRVPDTSQMLTAASIGVIICLYLYFSTLFWYKSNKSNAYKLSIVFSISVVLFAVLGAGVIFFDFFKYYPFWIFW